MAGIILLASILIWALGYFPRQHNPNDQQRNSYIGQLGQAIQPALAPLGFDWKASVSLLSGMAAKEVVVSAMSVLYNGDNNAQTLQQRLQHDTRPDGSPSFTPLTALAFMLFVLIYFPCIATITAIAHEAGSWKWGAFVILYTTALAWLTAFALQLLPL